MAYVIVVTLWFQIMIDIDSEGLDDIRVCLHAKNQFIPVWNFLFGTQCLYFSSATNTGIDYQLTLTRTHQLDTLDNPCTEDTVSVKDCVLSAIQENIGCRVKVLSRNVSSLSHLPLCQTTDQISEYWASIVNLSHHSPRSLYASTGCKAPCTRNTWMPGFRGNGWYAQPLMLLVLMLLVLMRLVLVLLVLVLLVLMG